MSAAVTDQITIDADPATVMAVIVDVGAYPDWQDEIKTAQVLDSDAQGRPTRAQLAVDAKIFTATYTLAYRYTDTRVSWELEESDQLDELTGAYVLEQRPDGGTDVTYELTVNPKIPIPSLLRRRAAKRISEGALQDLRRRVETGS